MSKVFVTQYTPKANFSKASDFGEVVFLTSEEYRPMPTPEGWNEDIAAEIYAKMKGYVPGHDYIMTTGSSIPNVLVGMILPMYGSATHKVLKWSNRMDGYEQFEISYPINMRKSYGTAS